MSKAVALMWLCFLFGSCGGSADDQKTCVSQPLRVLLLGDSTMAFWSAENGGTYDAGKQTEALQAYLDARFGAGSTKVTNRAVSGSRSTQFVAGTDGTNGPWPSPALDADLIALNYGINDFQARDMTGYRASLETIASTPGVRLVFETPNAVARNDAPLLATYAQTMGDVARAHKLPIADTYAFTVDKTAMLSDWGHPTAALYSQIRSSVLQPAIGAEVARMRCQ